VSEVDRKSAVLHAPRAFRANPLNHSTLRLFAEDSSKLLDMNNEDWYDNIKETVRRDVANRSHDEEDTIHRMFDGIKTYLSKESSRHINQKYLIALLEEVEIACSKLFSFKSSTSSVHAQPTDESIGYRQGRATLKQKFIEFDDFASPLPLNFQSPEEAFRHLDRHKEERSRSTKSLSKIDSKMELKKKRLSQTNIRANLPHSAPGRPATSLGFLEGEISQEVLRRRHHHHLHLHL